MNEIPIFFEHKGHFSKAAGAGGTGVWHLTDDNNYYLGKIRKFRDKWIFDPTPKTLELQELAEYFGELLLYGISKFLFYCFCDLF
jgi:hypothetical protein